MEEIKFTAEWGAWNGYFTPKYLAEYDFSGEIQVTGGKILNTERIIFPKETWGPFVYSKQFEPYQKTKWNSKLRNWFDGIRVTAQVEDDTVFRIVTGEKTVEFTPADLAKNGQLVFHMTDENKYSQAILHVEYDDPQWHYAPLLPYEKRLNGVSFIGLHRDFYGVKGVMLAPGQNTKISFSMTLPKPTSRFEKLEVRGMVRFLISESQDREARANGIPRFSILLNGKEVYQNAVFSCFHDTNSQWMEEVPFDIPAEYLTERENRLEIINLDENLSVLFPMIRILPEIKQHMQVTSCPKWALVGKAVCVEILCTEGGAKIEFEYDKDLFEPGMPMTKMAYRQKAYRGDPTFLPNNEEYIWKGKHEFFFIPKKAAKNAVIKIRDVWNHITAEAVIPEVWDIVPEEVPTKAGIELQTGNPWNYAYELRQIRDEQLANLVVFRDYHNRFVHYQKLWEVAADCRKYGYFTDSIELKDQNIIPAASTDRCQGVGGHEITAIFYGWPNPQGLGMSMRDSQQLAINSLRRVADSYRIEGVPVVTGDATGGSRCAYLAGFDMIRHETFVGHHTLILPNARGAAKAFHKKVWGVHIATQHNTQPELEDGLRRLWIGFFLPYLYGANFSYEEDSCFLCFKYYRMIHDDYMPRRKREITGEFYKYSQTHPRKGLPKVDIAVIQGRYAPPFYGFSTSNGGNEPDDPNKVNENFSVWGMGAQYGWEWGFRQPEKGFHLLEVLAPHLFLSPLAQDPKRVRKVFAGDPNGEFDFLPIEADEPTLGTYPLALMLNWNTMEYETYSQENHRLNDYDRFKDYVANGGTLFISVPQFTARADRGFLKDMEDVRLIYGGWWSDLCGAKVKGKSKDVFSGAVGHGDFADVDFEASTNSSRRPSDVPDEDGDCCIADLEISDAEVVVTDRKSGKPLVIRKRLGKGSTYLLCTYAFPGHEALSTFMPNFLQKLIKLHVKRSVFVEEPTGDVYWSNWDAGNERGKLYLLNTDWTEAHNKHAVTVHAGGCIFPYEAVEGELREVSYSPHTVLYPENSQDSLTLLESDGNISRYRLTGFGPTRLFLHADKDVVLTSKDQTYQYTPFGGRYRNSAPEPINIDLEEANGCVEFTVKE